MKKFLKEFGTFMSKGNVIDLAVGIMIGTSFQKIYQVLLITSLCPSSVGLFRPILPRGT